MAGQSSVVSFMEACKLGDLQAVTQQLVSLSAADSSKELARGFWAACCHGHGEIVRALLAMGDSVVNVIDGETCFAEGGDTSLKKKIF